MIFNCCNIISKIVSGRAIGIYCGCIIINIEARTQ